MAKIKDLPEGERPREKALIKGIESLSNSEVLALIISSGTKKYSALEIANNLLAYTQGIQNLKYLSIEDLKSIEGISEAKALQLMAIKELNVRQSVTKKVKVDENYLVSFFKKTYANETQEKSYLVLLDKNSNLLYLNTLFVGSENAVSLSSKLILSYILKYNAKKFYLIHNHPLGSPNPSKADVMTTNGIDFVSLSVGASLIDHLIFGKESYFSIRKNIETAY